MQSNRRQSEGAQRFAERRQRENESRRLIAEVPRLRSLALEIEEKSNGGPVAEPTHVRRVVVQHAPALFFLPCGDARCKEGGHDVTHAIMTALRDSETHFKGQDVCTGSVGTAQCVRVLHFAGIATYT